MRKFSTEEAFEKLMEIIDLQSDLIKKLMSALGQFEEFEKELKRINRLKGKPEE